MSRFLSSPTARRSLLHGAVLLSATLAAAPASAQSLVTGTVVDAEAGGGLPGVNVLATRLDPDSLRSR
ncbi:MAG TPA: hypothetical protein VF576_02055, partial [Rubricoccaceae bacterium]